ncbi:MAG: efflux RND transporter periplasmic adaptor subunit [Betaproteobacteria bacterium]|jgi:HlyD family secretion protein|nr:efflux RND transporter periplasmic adaptor subunit [Betaproteobacteria bacterium]
MALSRWSRWAIALVVLAIAAGAYLFLRRAGPLVDTVVLAPTRLAQTVVVSGRVLAPARVEIGSTITGRVARVAAAEGAKVAAGAPLLELEPAELAAALAQAVAAERAAATRIEQWKAVARPGVREQLAQAEANFRLADREAKRFEELYAKGFVGEARVDEVRRALAVARSQLDVARANAAAGGDQGVDRRLLDDQLAQARGAREAAQAKLAQTRIVAPAAGVVLDRNVEPGDIVQPGRSLLSLALDGPVRLTALIDEKNLAVLVAGQKAVASADAFPDRRFDAVLEYLSPGVDAQRGTVEAKFAVPSPPAYLRSDMTVSIDIGVAERRDALVVPAGALRDAATPSPWVLVARDGVAHRQAVRLGARAADRVEVVSGLAAGDRVVATPGIAEGARVRVRE